MIQAILLIVGMMAGVSLIAGGVIAAAVMIWTQDMAAAEQFITNGYYVVVGLMPVTLWLALYVTRDNSDYEVAYETPLRALLTTIQGALVGSLLGAGPIFLAVVIYLPVIVLHYPIETFGPAVRDAIVWSHLLLAVSAAVLSAIPLGFWAYYTGSGRED